MVYCGKPSKGCQACRERKTRCDKATPSCSQCLRAHRTCPGYRNQLDLMFRIENKTVIEKLKSREVSKSKATSKQTTPTLPAASPDGIPGFEGSSLEDEILKHSRAHVQRQGGFTSALMTPYTMAPTLEERARSFFVAKSVMWNPSFDLVSTLCTQTTEDDHLLASINAVGLASFANSIHMPELMLRARQDYILAMRLTNAALRSSTKVKKDSTLFSVMILSIFETIAGSTADSLVAWTEHINGAAALIKVRGPEQFKTEAGQRMFQQVTSSLMVSCVQRTVPMPAYIIELRESLTETIGGSNPAWILSEVIVDVTIFRAAVRNRQIIEPRRIVEEALKLDQRFLNCFENIPDNWRYEIRYTEENPHLVWNKYYHVYQDTFGSQIWNGMRTCRILLHEIIRDQLRTSDEAITPIFTAAEASTQNVNSIRITLEMQNDILASVPVDTPCPVGEGPGSHSLTYFILWPLYLVGVMGLSTELVRMWVIQRFRGIAQEIGIRQADLMADFLESRQVHDPWDEMDLKSWSPGPVLKTLKGLPSPMFSNEEAGIEIGGRLQEI